MKRLLSLLIVILLSLTTTFSAGAYTYEKDYSQNASSKLTYNSKAVKWNGRTELKPNTYYYTSSGIVIRENFTLPKNSVLEVRGALVIDNNTTFTVNGGLIVDYKGRVIVHRGTLHISDKGYTSCYGSISVSDKSTVRADNELVVYDAGTLTVKGTLNISGNGEVINGGQVQISETGKCNKEIITPVNVSDDLNKHLAKLNDNDKLQVDFNYYDSSVMTNTRLNGMSYLDVTLLLQDNIYIPEYVSRTYFSGAKGSYAQLQYILAQKSTIALRYMQSEYGGNKAYSSFLSNEYFKNVRQNRNYNNADSRIPELNKYVVSYKYRQLLNARIKLADMLNQDFLKQLENELKLENVSVRNVCANGYGVFTATLSKKQIYSLAKDNRFLFLSVTDDANIVNGKDKLYLNNGYGGYFSVDEWEKYCEENGNAVSVVLKDDICLTASLSNEVTHRIAKYTEFPNSSYPHTFYDTGEAGYRSVTDFNDYSSKMYRFHSFTDDLMKHNSNINLNKLYLQTAKSVSSYVYHRVDIHSAEELRELIDNDNVALILSCQFTLD